MRRLACSALAVTAGFAAAGARAATPCAPAVSPGPGVEDPFRAAVPEAVKLTADALTDYRRGGWDEARAKYRAALVADPAYLSPRLHTACTYVRQERWAEAVAEVKALLAAGYAPWAHEVIGAADLGALRVRPEMKEIEAAIRDAAARWSVGLASDVLFIARTREAVSLKASGVLVLAPQQELFAWSAATNRYRQLTTDDGRVLALSRSPDGRRVLYLTADKLVRPEAGAPALRGATLRVLDLGTLAVTEPAPLPGDAAEVELGWVGTVAMVRARDPLGPRVPHAFTVESGRLGPPSRTKHLGASVVFSPRGAIPPRPGRPGGDCRVTVRERRDKGVPPAIEITPARGAPFVLKTRFGAALAALPLLD